MTQNTNLKEVLGEEAFANLEQLSATQQAEKIEAEKLEVEMIWDENEKGHRKVKSIRNVENILLTDPHLKGLFGLNEFTGEIEIFRDEKLDEDGFLILKKGELNDSHIRNVMSYINKTESLLFSKELLIDGISIVSNRKSYHPVKDQIEKVEWDGKSRVDSMFVDYLGAKDNAYSREVSRKWLAGAIARIYDEGCQFELMPILIGGQGIGKSTLCRALTKDYFLDDLPSFNSDKETLGLITQNWIIEVAEMAGFGSASIEQTKKFTSTLVDKYRSPYARKAENHPRHCVFIGTSNDNEILKDKTGNRRFMPIHCHYQEPTKDVFNIAQYDVDQLLAEAKVIYDEGESIYLSKEIQPLIEEAQSASITKDESDDILEAYMMMPVPSDWAEYSVFQKRNYWTRYDEGEPLVSKSLLPVKDAKPIDRTSIKEILRVAFNLQDRDAMMNAKSKLYKKIRLGLEQDGWRKAKLQDGNKRYAGYKKR